jgi:glutamate-ammonia-ligase adenylyltransferase
MTRPATLTAFLTASPIEPLSKTAAKEALQTIREAASARGGLKEFVAAESPVRDFAVAALSLCPYLAEIVRIEPALLELALLGDIEEQIAAGIEAARQCWRTVSEESGSAETALMNRLRLAKRKVSFLLALADLARYFEAPETTRWLSRLADACLASAIDFLLLSLHEQGKITLPDPREPATRSGLIVLGMGKLGAAELNYSSDIDVVVFFEPDRGIVNDPDEASETFARLCRRLVRIMQERTAYGYVFRIDLRLRPDPGSTPLAIPVEAALIYYEGRGQNWERAAFIKARAVAGDISAGEGFLKELTPFIFRKYLDFAAIADIHSIKRQIHLHKGFDEIAVKGHNVKLGRGGIREIEFFAQTQQLIAGGRMPELRARRTDDALEGLARAHWIEPETAATLTAAYWFLRDVEHRIQMVHDEQSHILPDKDAELKRIALMMGFADVKSFSARLVAVLRTVEDRYAKLFEQAAELSGGSGNLVFTGTKDDPDTLKTLEGLGFQRPADISRVIRTWHSGRYRATHSVEARERLTEMMPKLLAAFGASSRADDALMHFDRFMAGLPAGIQLFSLLGNNPPLLDLLVTIMAAAPRLAGIIAARPHVFDGMLDPTLLTRIPERAYLAERLAQGLSTTRNFEDVLDALRIFAAEQRFLIGIRLLTGAISGTRAARAFSDLADLTLEQALAAVETEIAAVHGRFPGGRVCVIGMGKVGSRELTAGSDVDLILLYDHDGEAMESDGGKPLDANRYFGRLTQRLIAALSAPTAEGILYEVDMRLRPSGNKGPVATRINAFARYQREEAWTWEHMALTRARPIAGDMTLMREAEVIIDEIIALPSERGRIARDVAEMRALIDQEKPPSGTFDFKLIPGGLIDMEFIAQYLALMAGNGFVAGTPTAEVLAELGPSQLARDELDHLTSTFALLSDLSQVVRLCIDGGFDPKTAPGGLVDLLTRVANVPDVKVLEADVRARTRAVRKIFLALMKASG